MFSLQRKLLKTNFYLINLSVTLLLNMYMYNGMEIEKMKHLEKADSQEVLKKLFIINYCVHLDADRTQNK